MVRRGDDTGMMFREMLSYGITEDLQISFSVPWVFQTAPLSPARQTAMMPGTFDFETILGWRFDRQGIDVGSRRESTVYAGLILPSKQKTKGMLGDLEKAPGFSTAIATGIASRSHYLWAGASFTRFSEEDGDRRPQTLFYSIAWGYRPQAWRKDYPLWDWRIMTELTGETSSAVTRLHSKIPETGGHQIFFGPSALGIYRDTAVEAGIQFPIYRNIGSRHQKEKFRYALNFSHFF